MKNVKRIIVMFGIVLFAAVIAPPAGRVAAGPAVDANELLLAENKALRGQVASLQEKNRGLAASLKRQTGQLKAELAALKTQNAALEAELARLKSGRIVSPSKARTRPTTMKSTEAKRKSNRPLVRKGSVAVGVAKALIGKAALRNKITGVAGLSEDKLLTIVLAIFNESQERKLNYRTWGADAWKFGGNGSARLTDELGNVYKRIHFGATDLPIMRTDNESVYPGKCISDVLIFEPPVAKAKRLTLSLPLRNLGQEGTIKIIIPVAAIKRD